MIFLLVYHDITMPILSQYDININSVVIYHDIALIGMILSALYHDIRIIVMNFQLLYHDIIMLFLLQCDIYMILVEIHHEIYNNYYYILLYI